MSQEINETTITDTPKVPSGEQQLAASATAVLTEGKPAEVAIGPALDADKRVVGMEVGGVPAGMPPGAVEGGPAPVFATPENPMVAEMRELQDENRELLAENGKLRDEISGLVQKNLDENTKLREEIAALCKPQTPPPSFESAELVEVQKGIMQRIQEEAHSIHNIIDNWFEEHFHVKKIIGERVDAIEAERSRVSAAVNVLKGRLGL